MAALPEIEGAVVRLREVRVDDLDDIARLLGDARVTRHQLRRPPRTKAAIAAWIQLMLRRRAQGTVLCFVVTTRTAPTIVGIAQLSVPRAGNCVEWGWLLAPSLWGSGAFPDLATLLAGFARQRFGVTEVTARVHAANHRAAGALQKIESRLRSRTGSTMLWTTPTPRPSPPNGEAFGEDGRQPGRHDA